MHECHYSEQVIKPFYSKLLGFDDKVAQWTASSHTEAMC